MAAIITGDPHGTYPTPAELCRLAERAQERGIRIEGTADRPHAFEPSTGRTFDLTAISCTCRMFVVSGGCQHHALFLAGLQRPASPAFQAVA